MEHFRTKISFAIPFFRAFRKRNKKTHIDLVSQHKEMKSEFRNTSVLRKKVIVSGALFPFPSSYFACESQTAKQRTHRDRTLSQHLSLPDYNSQVSAAKLPLLNVHLVSRAKSVRYSFVQTIPNVGKTPGISSRFSLIPSRPSRISAWFIYPLFKSHRIFYWGGGGAVPFRMIYIIYRPALIYRATISVYFNNYFSLYLFMHHDKKKR